ncbi:MAG: hypothetical protein AB1632_14980 [Nitrospirota bacterium]
MNKPLQEKLCLNFCRFYKPAKDEELACMGFVAIERMIKKGKGIDFGKSGMVPDAATVKILSEQLCHPCPFYDGDCDFAVHKDDASPCGGFILLGQLLEEGSINVEDIAEATYDGRNAMKIYNVSDLALRNNGEYVLGSSDLRTHACYLIYGLLDENEKRRVIKPGKGHEEIVCLVKGEVMLFSEEKSFTLRQGQAVHLLTRQMNSAT